MEDKRGLKQLIADKNSNILQIIAHKQMIHMIKNQDPSIKNILNEETLFIILSYLNQQHPIDSNNIDLCYKLPQAAMEIMCCESHHITDLIFQSQKNKQQQTQQSQNEKQQNKQQQKQQKKSKNSKQLLTYLFNFLQYKQHYYLLGLFCKVVGSLSKRVFAPTHKYNQIMCNIIFGCEHNKPILFSTLNHIYSECTNQLIIRWLTLKSKDNSYRKIKQQFIQTILNIINTQQQQIPSQQIIINFGQQSLQSIINLILLLLKSPLQPTPQKPHQQQKNINLLVNKNAQKQLYQMISQQKFIQSIMQPIPNPRLQKLKLIYKIMQKMRIQNEQIQKMEEQYKNLHLSDIISDEMMIECLSWINQNLLTLANQIQYENNQQIIDGDMFVNDDCENANNSMAKIIKKQSMLNINKKYLLAYLQLLYEFHLHVNQLRQPLTYWYEEKAKQQVQILVKFLKLKNNLISSQLTKIITIVLTKLNCPDFSTMLLHHGISQVIDEQGIREHVLGWANIILQNKSQKGHIFQNFQEQSKWDHMAQIVAEAQQIVMGRYRHKPSSLDFFYSLEKARDNYAAFLMQPIIIQYQQKSNLSKKVQSQKQKQIQILTQGQNQITVLKKKMSSPPTFGQPRNKDITNKIKQKVSINSSIQQNIGSQIQSLQQQEINNNNIIINENKNNIIKQIQEQKMDVLGLDCIRHGYLSYQLTDLLNQLY